MKPSGDMPSGVPDGDGTTVARKQANARRSGGPGTDDPGRIHYPHARLKDLLLESYEVPAFQIEGPNWLDDERFDIDATLPAQTTKAQFHVMLQNLLVDRFKMMIHRETKEFSGYALVVAKSRPKLKEWAEASASQHYDDPEKRAEATDSYGLPLVSPNAIEGRPAITFWNGPVGLRLYAQQQTMPDVAKELANRWGSRWWTRRA